MDFSGVGEAVVGVLVGGGTVLMAMRKKLSADNVDVARNQLEIDMMQELKTQALEARQEAKDAERGRVEAMLQVEALKGQVQMLTQQILALREEIVGLKQNTGGCSHGCTHKGGA